MLLRLLEPQTHVVVWIESDAVYTEDLTTREELVPGDADVVLMDDGGVFCGCFAVFNNATDAGFRLYSEVIRRLDEALKAGNPHTLDDQVFYCGCSVAALPPPHPLYRYSVDTL